MMFRGYGKPLGRQIRVIYQASEEDEGIGEMMAVKSSRKGLSPLLAIIIGLVVTIVAGILLAQLYFSYAATISARPAANVEYADLVVSGSSGVLTVNIKNTGNVPISSIRIEPQSGAWGSCTIYYSTTSTRTVRTKSFATGVSGEPGETITVTCPITSGVSLGSVVNVNVVIGFTDGSTQAYGVSVRARSA